jgi:hypothetical protein
MNLKRISLGSFQLGSGQMAVSDPCYDRSSSDDMRGELSNVKNGTWNAFSLRGDVPMWGDRIHELQVLHESISYEAASNDTWTQEKSFHVGVDSGQAGFFDNAKYPYGNIGEYGETETFYGRVCETTMGGSSGGIIEDFGVASSTGYGDGCYQCFVLRNEQDEIVGSKIIFISPESEENDVEI